MPRKRIQAFSLIELLVVVAILGLLAGMLLPVIGTLQESARRATDLASLRQLTAAALLYAADNGGTLPVGRMEATPPGRDDYTWLSYRDAWKPLTARVPELNTINSCASVRTGYGDVEDFGTIQPAYGAPNDTIVGWMYWGGRDDLVVNGALKYRSPRRVGDRLTPGSATLWTCWCWDSNGDPSPSICPHVQTRFVQYPGGVPLKPAPEGLGVALLDGSASFVAWNDMIIITQANGFKLYYQP